MKKLLLAVALAAALAGCSDRQAAEKKAAAAGAAAPSLEPGHGDKAAGAKIAEADCKACHGMDGRSVAPAIPHLAGQHERYLLGALAEYRQGKRTHAALRRIATQLTEKDVRDIAAYYASQPPVGPAAAAAPASPYEMGRKVSEQCASCHGPVGNSTAAGVPSLAGQQPRYLVAAIHEYLGGERKTSPMHARLTGIGRVDVENVALFYASQGPAARTPQPKGDPKAGEQLAAVCGGCHGMQGVSTDSATPSLAGQDEQYLVGAIKEYRTSRRRENMRTYVQGISDRDIENIAAFYAVQTPKTPEKGQTLVQEYVERCNKCHAPGVSNPAVAIPRIQGQDKDYLVMALREYRDGRRESSTMHNMSLPYGESIIDSIAAYYASQPAR